jgi:hypothetical protein
MFRFTIRDVLCLMVVVGMGLIWRSDRQRQNARMQALEELAGVEAIEIFPRDWDGRTAAFRNQTAILRFQVDALTHELQSRGHRVEVDGSNVFVDRPAMKQGLAPIP